MRSTAGFAPPAEFPPFRWGIVSTGHIAGVFADDVALLPDAAVVAVASRDADRARAFAAAHAPAATAYDDVGKLAADPAVDAVYVASPHSEHHGHALACLSAGKPVLCEKALTLNASQAEELVDVARRTGTFLMEAMWMRCNPVHIALVELVRSGTLGEPCYLLADLGIRADPRPGDRLFDPALGGGALLDCGVYPVALAQALLGEPAAVAATGTLADTGVDLTSTLALRYPGGAAAALTGSLAAQTPGRAAIACTKGWVSLPSGFQCADHYTLHREGRGPQRYTIPLLGAGYTYEAIEVARCVRAGLVESPLVPHADSVAVMRVLDAARAQLGVRYPGE